MPNDTASRENAAKAIVNRAGIEYGPLLEDVAPTAYESDAEALARMQLATSWQNHDDSNSADVERAPAPPLPIDVE